MQTVFRYSHGFYLFPVLARILSFSDIDTDSTIFRYSFAQFFGTHTDSTFSQKLARILSFFGTDPDSTIFQYSFGQFFGTHTDSTFSRYSPGFYQFSVMTLILPFFRSHSDRFSIIARILPFPGLARILSFFGTDPDFTIIRYSCRQFFGTRTDSTFSRNSPGFYHFSVMTLILPFFGTRSHNFSVLIRILPFPGTRPNSYIFWYSH